MPRYKNNGLRLSFSTIISIWVHKFLKGMIASSNLVATARLVIDESDTHAIDVE